MDKTLSTCVALFLLLLAGSLPLNAQTQGTLSVSTSTSSAGGNYSPKNIVAIWVTDSAGSFVKTLLAYAASRRTHLNTWEAATTAAGSAYNVTDAISGATRTSHGTRICSWNGRNYNQVDMPDGTYRLWFELTDKNATGNFSHFDFVKGPLPQNQTPANVPSFSGISIAWQPGTVGIDEIFSGAGPGLHYDPAQRRLFVTGSGTVEVSLFDLGGRLLYSGRDQVVDLRHLPAGLVLLKLREANAERRVKLLLN
ncbi:MAG TPA: DUF2271 domain-containing protein [Bacteroidales bacterium]|nr:DUF2271 domain-containing protein [Bacteroidales bacterium]HRZ75871.1 DUF2271 domain-containing protein [Bacteroidales bacterium]